MITPLAVPGGRLIPARFGIAIGAIGAARDCLETTLACASERTQFGRPVAGFQLTQQKLADMSLELSKGLLLALHLARPEGGGQTPARAGQRGPAEQRPGGSRKQLVRVSGGP